MQKKKDNDSEIKDLIEIKISKQTYRAKKNKQTQLEED